MNVAETISLIFVGIMMLGGGIWSSTANRTFHAVMGLGISLVGVAGMFILLGSPFIGIFQILVYVGGILTLFVFAVMFVTGDEEEQEGTA